MKTILDPLGPLVLSVWARKSDRQSGPGEGEGRGPAGATSSSTRAADQIPKRTDFEVWARFGATWAVNRMWTDEKRVSGPWCQRDYTYWLLLNSASALGRVLHR